MSLDDNFAQNVTTAQTVPLTVSKPEHRPVASWLHTVVLVLVMLGLSFLGSRSQHRHAAHAYQNLYYLLQMAMEWVIVGYVYLGIRRRGLRLQDIVGGDWNFRDLLRGKWDSLLEILLDVAIAAGFWVVSLMVLGALGYFLGLGGTSGIGDAKEKLGGLIPQTVAQVLMFIPLSITAGFCEEVIFRGYLQRQFTALGRTEIVGILLQAAVFGLGHGYQGGPRMFMLAVYGAMFGIVASMRKSLRPGMITHAWQDAISGVMMYVLFVVLKK